MADAGNQDAGPDPEPEDTTEGAGDEGSDPSVDEASVDEAELRRRIEEGLREVRMQDVLLESVVTFINLTARRIGKEDERDLEQARIGIEAVRSLLELLEDEPQTQVRNALAELQMLYAQFAGEGAGEAPADEPPSEPERPQGPGLWTPPGA
jgi:hypothetical protein